MHRLTGESAAGWEWDETLYSGAAAHYARGRTAYPRAVAEALREALGLDGTGRLLDVGCGPGSLTLLLAPHVGAAIGVDADPGMLAEAARQAEVRGIGNATWRLLRAEELPADLPAPDVVTFAQSFHWMDRPVVAGAVRGMLAPGAALVHVSATTHRGDEAADQPAPPPYAAIDDLVRRYLGPDRRAGRGVITDTASGEDAIYRAAGFTGPARIELPGWTVQRSVDQVAAAILSLSSSAPHLFGDRLAAFDADLRTLLADASDGQPFVERMRTIRLDIWR